MEVRNASQNSQTCEDIAHQLILGETGKHLNVILGGGRSKFLPYFSTDEEGDYGDRIDGVNLIDKWIQNNKRKGGRYVWNRQGLLDAVNSSTSILGLFESSHMQYNLEADKATEPTLAEMTEAAIKVLEKGNNGYFLFVEGGRIDHAHHANLAQKALDETVQFSEAIQKAVDLTSRKDTLIVVTSDHAHTMSMNGYPQRGNDIFGMGGNGLDDMPYSTLSYANGPSFRYEEERHNLASDNMGE